LKAKTEYPIFNKEYPMKKATPETSSGCPEIIGMQAQALGYWRFLVGCWIFKKEGF